MAISMSQPRLVPLAASWLPFGPCFLPPSLETLPEEYDDEGVVVKGRRLVRSSSWAGYAPTSVATHYADLVPRAVKAESTPEEAPPQNEGAFTTYAVMGVRCKMTRRAFENALIANNFAGDYDYIYMVKDFHTKLNKRCVFVNFRTPEAAARFAGSHLPNGNEQAAWRIMPAKIQGKAANMAVSDRKRSRVTGRKFWPKVID